MQDTLLPIQKDLFAGMDVGGTKTQIADTVNTTIRRYNNDEYDSIDAILSAYFKVVGSRPAHMTIGIAGPRDDDTGDITLTNRDWPVFNPRVATKRYGILFETANDMVITMAGVLQETGIDLLPLKPGTSTRTGAKLVITLSTGFGVASAMWDSRSRGYVIAASEGGHIGFQPKTAREQDYLEHLHAKYPHASAELALAGKQGIGNLVDHLLDGAAAPNLAKSITHARANGAPVGAVLVEYATRGKDADREAAKGVLEHMGSILGSVLRDLAVSHKATGGVYLTGSVSLGMSEYLAQHTSFRERFVRAGAAHDSWLERVPISLVANPSVAVAGALALAKASTNER